MNGDQIILGALRNIDVPKKGNNKGDKLQLKFEGLVSKEGHSVEEKSTNLGGSTVSLPQTTKGPTAKLRNPADANKVVEQLASADTDVENGKHPEPTAKPDFETNDVRSRWRLHTGVTYSNVDFSRSLTEHEMDVAAETPHDLPSKIEGSLHKSVRNSGPVKTAHMESDLPLPENTDALQNEPSSERITQERTEKLPIGNGGQSTDELLALKTRDVTRSEAADRFGAPPERWSIRRPEIDVNTSKSMISQLNVQQSIPAELRGSSLTDKLSKRLEPITQTKPHAEPVPIKLDRQPDLASIRDGRLNADVNATAQASEKVQLHTKVEARSLAVNPVKSDEIFGTPPNAADLLKSPIAGPIQPGGAQRSTVSSNASASLLAAIEANSNWASHLKASATAIAAKPDRNGNTPQILRIQLHPTELGAMDATMRISGDRLHLTLSVEQDSTLRSLLRDSQAIHNALRASGFHVDELTITGTSQQNDLGTNERTFANGNAAQEETENGERPARKQLHGERDANDETSNETVQDSDSDGLYI